jgi:hypothetical protein
LANLVRGAVLFIVASGRSSLICFGDQIASLYVVLTYPEVVLLGVWDDTAIGDSGLHGQVLNAVGEGPSIGNHLNF